jgi:RNA polymerase sigma-70 factor (ECF subfamily)
MNAPDTHPELATDDDSLSAVRFAEFYASHLPQVKAFLSRAGCDPHSLDDLAQETFLRAWHARGRFQGAVQLRTWLFGIAKNTARESSRKRKFSTEPLNHDPSQDTAQRNADELETAQIVRDAVCQLPDKQRMAISLVYFNGITQCDAASKTNCAHDAFRRRLSSGRKNLRKLLRSGQRE